MYRFWNFSGSIFQIQYLFISGTTNGSEGGDYNCFLRAVEEASGQKISRDDIANHIVNDPRISQYIEMGIHEHFLRRGKFGGVSRTNEQQEFMEEMAETLRNTHPKHFNRVYNRFKEKWLDKAEYQHEGKRGKKSGNDEIWQRKEIRQAHQKVWDRNNMQNDSVKGYDDFCCTRRFKLFCGARKGGH